MEKAIEGKADEMDMDFAQSLSAWICHELSQPLTSIGNGLELLRDAPPEERGEILALLDGSRAAAYARLRAARRLFAPRGERVSIDEMREDLLALAASHDALLNLSGEGGAPPPLRPMLYGVSLAAMSGLKPSSSLIISVSRREAFWEILVRAVGHEAARAARIADIFAGGSSAESLAPPDIPAHCAGALARGLGATTKGETRDAALILKCLTPIASCEEA